MSQRLRANPIRSLSAIVTVAVVSLLLSASGGWSDTLVLKNGAAHEGHLIEQNDEFVTFEIQQVGISLTIRRPVSMVDRIIRSHEDQATFSVLPVLGPIGQTENVNEYTTAQAFTRALAQIRESRPDVIILIIRSPGGQIEEMRHIVRAIENTRESRFIAFVLEAHSAAAVIAMACPTIYLVPDATIGAAVPYSLGPDGTPKNIEEKWLSAIRAGFRNVSKLGGHSPLLIRGMSETQIELSLIHHDGEPRIIEGRGGPDAHVIKRSGEILTLTAGEALRCGLSSGTVSSLPELREQLGIESWRQVHPDAWKYVLDRSRQEMKYVRMAREEAERQRALAAEREAYSQRREAQIDRVVPELQAIETRLAALDAQVAASNIAARELLTSHDAQLNALFAEYRRLRLDATRYANALQVISSVDANYVHERERIISGYQMQLAEINERRNQAAFEAERLRDRHRALADGIPPALR